MRCRWAKKTKKIDKKYAPGPCKIMVWRHTFTPLICNGFKPECQGKSWDVSDKRDTPLSWAQWLKNSVKITSDPLDPNKPDHQ